MFCRNSWLLSLLIAGLATTNLVSANDQIPSKLAPFVEETCPIQPTNLQDLEKVNFFVRTILKESRSSLQPLLKMCKNFKIELPSGDGKVQFSHRYNLYQALQFLRLSVDEAIEAILSGKVMLDEELADAKFKEAWTSDPDFRDQIIQYIQFKKKCLKDFIEGSGVLEKYYMPIASTHDGQNIFATLDDLLKSKYISMEEALVKFEDGSVVAFHDNQAIDFKTQAKTLGEKFVRDFAGNKVHSYVSSFIFSGNPSILSPGANPQAGFTITPGQFYTRDGAQHFYNPLKGIDLYANFAPNPNSSHHFGATIDHTGLYSYAGHKTQDQAFGGWAFLMPGWYGAGGQYAQSVGEQTYGGGAALFGERNALGMNANVGMATDTFAAAAKGIIAISKDREVKWLGQYPQNGEVAELRGKHQVKVKYKNGYMVRSDLGLSPTDVTTPLPLAVGVRLKYQKDSELEHTLWIEDSEQTRAFLDKQGIHKLHRVLEDISVEKEMKNLDLLHPLKMRPGEQVKFTTVGSISGAIVLSLAAITGIDVAILGAAAALHGEFQLEVTRLGDKKVMVGIRPTEISSQGLFLIIAKTFGVSRAKEILKSLQYNFVFDFAHEETENHYKEFIETGKIPFLNDLADLNTTFRKNLGEAVRVLGSFRKNKPILEQKGITQTFFSSELSPAQRTTASILLSPWHELQASSLKAQPTIIVSNGEGATEYKTWQMELSRDKLMSGDRKKSIFASVKTEYRQSMDGGIEETTGRPGGITFRAEFTENRVRGDENNLIVDELNTYFGRLLDHYKIPGHGENIKVSIERSIFPHDIQNLLDKKGLGEGTDVITEASMRTGISQEALSKLLMKLNHQGQDEQAVELMNFIHQLGNDGLKGFAAIHILFGGNSRNIAIKSENSDQTQAIEQAAEFIHLAESGTAQSFAKEVQRSHDPSAINADKVASFYNRAKNITAQLEQALVSIKNDPTLVQNVDEQIGFNGKRNLAATRLESVISHLKEVETMKDVEISKLGLEEIKTDKDYLAQVYQKIGSADIDPLQATIRLYAGYAKTLTQSTERQQVMGFIPYTPTQKHFTLEQLLQHQEALEKVKNHVLTELVKIAKSIEEPLSSEIDSQSLKRLNLKKIPASEAIKILQMHAPEIVQQRQQRLLIASALIKEMERFAQIDENEFTALKERLELKDISEKELKKRSAKSQAAFAILQQIEKRRQH